MIQGHGNDIYKYKTKILFDFSSNIAYNNQSQRIVEHLKGKLDEIINYPDPSAEVLSKKIARHHGLERESIVVCNGSAEGFYMVAHWIAREATGRARSLVFTPSFAEYEDSCTLYGHSVEFSSLRNFNTIDYSSLDSVWIGTPNNPDGIRIPLEVIIATAKANPRCQFIVDRAYNELSGSMDDTCGEICENIIFLHSLTKSYGIPGVRLGYIVAHSKSCEQLTLSRAPWSVNALSLAAGEFVMDNYLALQVDINELLAESQKLQQELAKIDYLDITISDTNFFLCRINNGRTAKSLHKYLLDKHGILIRDCSNFRGLTPHHFRIAVQHCNANKELIYALEQWI